MVTNTRYKYAKYIIKCYLCSGGVSVVNTIWLCASYLMHLNPGFLMCKMTGSDEVMSSGFQLHFSMHLCLQKTFFGCCTQQYHIGTITNHSEWRQACILLQNLKTTLNSFYSISSCFSDSVILISELLLISINIIECLHCPRNFTQLYFISFSRPPEVSILIIPVLLM